MSTENQSLEEILFNLAVQKSTAEEIVAFLDAVCQGKPDLRSSLEQLLEGHFQAAGFLPIIKSSPPQKESNSSESPDSSIPTPRIGRYKLLEKIGEGGFGEVWMADQREPIKRRVAIKIVKPGMDSRAIIGRFEAERQALALMDHANIARVFDAGTTENGRPYFVMELVRGIKITEYCDQHHLSTRERLDLFILVCQAIHHAHQKGIIHRDIKPSNILVTLHDGVPVPKVIDFGIAKASQIELTDKTVFTQFQQFIGTPAYISPEQAEMSGLDVDTRSDIYSLGVLLYELLVGCTPLDAEELIRGGLDAMRMAIREKEPLKPSTRFRTLPEKTRTTIARRCRMDELVLSHQLRGDLDWIVMKALEKDRTRRYESAFGFAQDIQRFIAAETVTARPPSTLYKIQKAWQRNKLIWSSLTTVALALLLGFCVSTWQALRAMEARKAETQLRILAETNQKQAEEAQQKAETLEYNRRDILYEANLNLVQSEFEQLNFDRTRRLLNETRDHPKRGFEWNYWHGQMNASLLTLRGHIDEVVRVAFSPDGRQIISGDESGLILIWDAITGEPQQRLAVSHLYPASAELAFSPDGKKILIQTGTGWNDTLHLFDANTGKLIWKIPAKHSGSFSPDEQEIAVIYGNTIQILNVTQGDILREFGIGASGIYVRFSADGSALFSGTAFESFLLHAQTGHRIQTITQRQNDWPCEYLSHNQQMMASQDAFGGQLKLWNTQKTNQELAPLAKNNGGNQLTFSSDDRYLLGGFSDFTARLYDTSTFKEIRQFEGHAGAVLSVAFSPDDRKIATASSDGTVRIWETKSNRNPDIWEFQEKQFSHSALSPDGHRVAIALGGRVAILDSSSGEELKILSLFPQGMPDNDVLARINTVTFSPDGKRILTSGWNYEVKVLDASSGENLLTLNSASQIVWSAKYSPDGKKILTTPHEKKQVKVWDAIQGKEVLVCKGPTGEEEFYKAIFSPDGKRIAAIGQQATVFWDSETGKILQTLPGSGYDMDYIEIAFSRDGTLLATSSADGTATIWDATTYQAKTHLLGHKDFVSSIGFSPDGTQILTGSRDTTARLWDTETGRQVLTFKDHSNHLRATEFFPDGLRILTSSWDKTVRIWKASSTQEIKQWDQQEALSAQRVTENRAWWEGKKAQFDEKIAQDEQRCLTDPGAVKHWLVSDSIPIQDYGNIATQYIPNEAELHPRSGPLLNQALDTPSWTPVHLDHFKLTLKKADHQGFTNAAIYAVTYLKSQADQTNLTFKIGSSSQGMLYLNGMEVYRFGGDRFWRANQDQIKGLNLRQGLNVLVYKTILHENNERHLSLWITDSNENSVPGLQAALDPDDIW